MTPPAAPAPKVVSHYRIVSRIGSGGMGEVYRAVDERLGREVALKLLVATGGASADRQVRLLREAQAASALNHPGIVTLHDVGAHEGRPYLVMELVDGERLSDLAGKIDPREAFALCAEAADALAAAHARGILHRDVKSDNLMRTRAGRLKVLDFGLAKLAAPGTSSSSDVLALLTKSAPGTSTPSSSTPTAKRASTETLADTDDGTRGGEARRAPAPSPALPPAPPGAADANAATLAASAAHTPDAPRTPASDSATLTRVGDVIGTPAYMSPEQTRGEPALPQSEIFSLGIVLYELLVGRRPFDGATIDETLRRVRAAAPTPPSAAAGKSFPRGVDALVLRALAARPADRFPDMRAFATELRRLVDTLDPRLGRRRAWLTAAAVLLVASSVAALVFRPRRLRPPPVFHPRDVRRLTVANGCEEFPSFTPDGKKVIYDAESGPNDWLYSIDVDTQETQQLTAVGGWDYAPAVSPDGRRVAFLRKLDGHSATWVMDLDGRAPPRKLMDGGMRPAWSPDGTALWGGHAETPTKIALADGRVLRTLKLPAEKRAIRGLELPDGRFVGIVYPSDTQAGADGLAVWAPGAAESTWLVKTEVDEVLALEPGLAAVLTVRRTAAGQTELLRVPFDGTPAAALAGNEVAPAKGMDLSRDAKRLVWSTCRAHTGLSTVSADPGGGAHLVDLPSGNWGDLGPWPIHGTGELLVISDRDGYMEPWVIDRHGGGPPRKLHLVEVEPDAAAVSPDGKTIVVDDGSAGLFVGPTDGKAPFAPLDKGAGRLSPTFSRDGQTIYYEIVGEDESHHVARIAVTGGASEPLLAAGTGAPDASPVDDTLVYVEGKTGPTSAVTPMLLDLATHERRPLSTELPAAHYQFLRFSPDGQRIAMLFSDHELIVVERASGHVVLRVPSGTSQFIGCGYGADGELFVTRTTYEGDLWIARDPY